MSFISCMILTNLVFISILLKKMTFYVDTRKSYKCVSKTRDGKIVSLIPDIFRADSPPMPFLT